MFSNNLLNFFLNTTIINSVGIISYEKVCYYFSPDSSYLKVGEGSWGKDELVKSSEEGSHESVGLGDINFSGVVNIEFSPGSWEEFSHVGLHLGLRNLLGDEEDFGSGFLGTILIEDLGSGGLSSSVGDWHSIVVEDVVHNIILISTVVSGGWGISGGWVWLSFDLDGGGGSEESSDDSKLGEFHFDFINYNNPEKINEL